MINIEHSVVINRPIAEVFEFVADVGKRHLWDSVTVKAEQDSADPMGVGTTGHSSTRFLGRNINSSWEVIAYSENRKIGSKSTSGSIPFELVTTFESVEGGTKLTSKGQYKVGGFFKLAEPVVGRIADRTSKTSLDTLKDLLEA